MKKMYKILATVAICTVPWLLSGCSDNDEPEAGDTMAKSDPVEEVDPYEPIIYHDPDLDFSTMGIQEYYDYMQQLNVSPAYSDHLFSDDAVNTRFSAAGGEKVIIPERGCMAPRFKWATTYDVLNDGASEFKYDEKDWNGNECFRICVWDALIKADKLPLQPGDIVSVQLIPPGSMNYWLFEDFYKYLDERGVEKVSTDSSGYHANKILTLKPGVDKWLEIAIDSRRRTITLKASPNNTGVKRVITISFQANVPKACINNVVRYFYDVTNQKPYLNNAIRVEQAAE